MVKPVTNAIGKSSQLGVSNGSNSRKRIYKYGVDRLYNEMFFNRKTWIKTKTKNRSRFITTILLILFLLSLQPVLFVAEFIINYVYILQFTKVYRQCHFHV
jgi:hypothetical protein